MENTIERFDKKVIMFLRHEYDLISRLSLFIIFFWFGILKVFLLSPAGPLVTALLNSTFLNGIDPDLFVQIFGLFEIILAIMLMIPKLERITFALLLFHLFTTIMPLFMIPEYVWDAPMVPNLIGQYIIKNVALLSLGLALFARLKPMTKTHSIVGIEENKINF